ncbi:hypothetical protein C8R45DRAFT_1085965 [Mycena sanguinolenta]|nr:hypothetical protein C8R45DRAFT_1085965 [Mycena sanguinolenta]
MAAVCTEKRAVPVPDPVPPAPKEPVALAPTLQPLTLAAVWKWLRLRRAYIATGFALICGTILPLNNIKLLLSRIVCFAWLMWFSPLEPGEPQSAGLYRAVLSSIILLWTASWGLASWLMLTAGASGPDCQWGQWLER